MNFAELRASIAREDITLRSIAKTLNITEQALYNKMSGVREFKGSEIKKLAVLLKLSLSEVNVIFFDSMVN